MPPQGGRAFEGDFEDAIKAERHALDAFVDGDPEPVVKLFSRRDDVTVANLLGGRRRGSTQLEHAISEAAAKFKETSGNHHVDEVSRHATAELGYVIQFVGVEARSAGREPLTGSLWVT